MVREGLSEKGTSHGDLMVREIQPWEGGTVSAEERNHNLGGPGWSPAPGVFPGQRKAGVAGVWMDPLRTQEGAGLFQGQCKPSEGFQTCNLLHQLPAIQAEKDILCASKQARLANWQVEQ